MYYSDRLMLRSVDLETDQAAILQLFNDTGVVGIGGTSTALPADRDFIKSWIEKTTKKWKETGLPSFVVCEKPKDLPTTLDITEDLFLKDGKPRYPLIGMFNFFRESGFSIVNRTATVGIALDRAHQGKGLGTELMTWAMDFAFDSLNLHKVELVTYSNNKAAVHVYEKVGFVHEGRLRSAKFIRGEWFDGILMGILEDEWRERRQK